MASSSSSSSTRFWKYDVFLSFRGKDTRKNIVSHLFWALHNSGILTFKDDQRIEPGDSISDELIKAIHTSRFAIVVISENYAASRWCLEELREIMEAVEGGTNVVPIFYGVNPCDVRHPERSFATVFASMGRPETDDKVLKWREALTNVADLSGFVSSTCVDEATMVEKVVRKISDGLLTEYTANNMEDIVGMSSHIESLGSLLDMESKEEVRFVGISGMGGVGKTTIAQYLYGRFSRLFPAHYFLHDVKKIYREQGLSYLQEKLLSKIQNRVGSQEIKGRLKHRKVFVVLDDVDKVEQLQGLAKEPSWFGPGSRIIITTRDKSLLDICKVDTVYAVKCLDQEDALRMFKHNVFGGKLPPHGFDQLLIRVSRLAHGLPLALKAYSLYLHRKTKEEWKKAACMFEKAPQKNILDTLRSSYEGLAMRDKIAFLYVACLFNGDHFLRASTLLDDGESRIKVLEEQSLVDISAEGSLTMHALVEQTGREIVLEESNHVAQKQRILWDSVNVYNVLRDNTGTRSIEGLVLNMCEMPEVLHIAGSRFRQMPNVKFLKFYTHLANRPSNLKLLRDTTSLPRMLRLLHWDAYPLTLLPSEFCPHSLVELTLRYSNLQILCSRNLNLRKLKRLDVSRSKDMKELPNLSMAVQLEELVVEGCEKLKFLVELPRSLNYLNAHGCSSLQTVSLPSRHSINHLDLSGCSQLNQVQQLITQFLTGGQHEELEASLRFACIPQIVMPNYFDNQSPGATIQLSPNIMDFAACVIVACRRPFHLQFSKTSYSGKWDEGGGVFQINLKPELHRSLEMEGEEAINSYLVLIQVLGSVNNDQAGNFISTLQLPLTVEPPPAEIIACGVRMNLM
ncbi:NB-ARC [Arabidopsis suecica]|uniref:NB-ARC n=1 Tax=Arabidopsis suecica TaxID=45249 RepID=A0A8T2HGK2_ARASU|nr:NB-ARC [Arabidopsis suecica]